MTIRRGWLPALVAGASLAVPSIGLCEADRFGLGDGHSGARVVAAAGTVVNTYTQLQANAAIGATSVAVTSAAGFVAGDLVLLFHGTGLAAPASGDQTPIALGSQPVGHYELARVQSVAGNTLNLTAALVSAFSASVTQVIRVPEYTNVTINIGAGIVASPWNGATGGGFALK